VSDFSIFSNRLSPEARVQSQSQQQVEMQAYAEKMEQRRYLGQMMDSSFLNMPLLQDGQNMEVRCPQMIEEGLDEIKDEQDKPTIEDVIDSRAYPTQVMICK
jgi:hypothetical protein